MKLKRTLTYRLILDYLKDKLSDNKRHIVEKELMRDAFDEEAFEGLTAIPTNELEKDMIHLHLKLKQRTNIKTRIPLYNYLKIAALIIILFGVVIAIRISTRDKFETPVNKQIAEKTENTNKKKQITTTSIPVEEKKKENKPVITSDQLAYESSPTETKPQAVTNDEYALTEEMVVDIEEPENIQSVETGKYEEAEKPAATMEARRAKAPKKTKIITSKAIKGRVTDAQGTPLPGVSIFEKGTSNGAISDINGEFEVELKDTENPLEFKFLGYITEETTAENIKNNDIKLFEDLVALDEVVVIGYGTQKKSDITGSVSSVKAEEPDDLEEIEPIQARPPTGSVLSFKKYIYNKIDYSKFIDLIEKQKIVVEFIIDDKGIPGNYKFKQPADERICNEIKRIIDEAGKWQPSTKSGSAIVSQIRMRLVIDPISKGK